jgi:hypothetical protein
VAFRNRLNSSSALRGILAGGIYPLTDDAPDELSKANYPDAFDSWGELLPTALVRDSTATPQGPYGARGASQVIDVLLWQQRGRDKIDAALKEIRRLLEPATALTTADLWVYRIRYAGDINVGQDSALGDAEHGWQRWQVATALKG